MVVALVAGAAVADDDEQVPEATQLFTRGRELFKAGDAQAACPLFEQSLRLAPALGTKLNLALCWVRVGKLVAAYDLFVEVEREATAANQTQRAVLAREGIEGLEKRLAKLTIKLGDVAAGTQVQLDGRAVAAESAIALDPGEHRLLAPGAREVVYHTKEGELGEVTLERLPEYERPQEVWITGGAAAGAFAIGTITGIEVLRDRDAALHHCDGALACDQRGLDLLSHAHTMSHVTTFAFLAGLGLGATAVVLELRSRKEHLPPIVVLPTPNDVTVDLVGAW